MAVDGCIGIQTRFCHLKAITGIVWTPWYFEIGRWTFLWAWLQTFIFCLLNVDCDNYTLYKSMYQNNFQHCTIFFKLANTSILLISYIMPLLSGLVLNTHVFLFR